MNTPSTSESWLVSYVARSRLVQLFFDTRERLGHDISTEMEWIASTFLLGRCLFFAAALGQRNGRDHVVAFHGAQGLVHAVFACAPQDGQRLAGDYVDAVTRGKLSAVRDDLSRFAGDLVVQVGEIPDPEDLGDVEALIDLARALPWVRPFTGRSLLPPQDLREAVCRLSFAPYIGQKHI